MKEFNTKLNLKSSQSNSLINNQSSRLNDNEEKSKLFPDDSEKRKNNNENVPGMAIKISKFVNLLPQSRSANPNK